MTLLYTDALELKEAGFPQLFETGKAKGSYIGEGDTDAIMNLNLYYAPSLEELIEACGDGFQSLDKIEDTFYANANGFVKQDIKPCAGSSPIQAVARLWIELNKK